MNDEGGIPFPCPAPKASRPVPPTVRSHQTCWPPGGWYTQRTARTSVYPAACGLTRSSSPVTALVERNHPGHALTDDLLLPAGPPGRRAHAHRGDWRELIGSWWLSGPWSGCVADSITVDDRVVAVDRLTNRSCPRRQVGPVTLIDGAGRGEDTSTAPRER